MKLNDSRRFGVIVTAVGAIAVLASTGLAAASPATGAHATIARTAHTPAPRPKPGLFVTGEAKVATTALGSAYVTDGDNREHFVTLVKSPTQPSKDVVYYYTRALGAKKWNVHAAPTLINAAGSPRIEADAAWDLDEVEVVVYACDGIYAAAVSPTAERLPEFTLVQSADTCSSSAAASSAYQHSSTIFRDLNSGWDLGVLAPDAATTGTWDIVEGNPGGTFTSLLSLPTADHFVPTQLAASPDDNADLAVVGHGVDSSGDKGIFATTLSWTYNSTAGADIPSWGALKEIASLGQKSKDFAVQSLAEYDGTTDVALYEAPGTTVGQKHTLFIDEGDTSNQWSSPIGLDHTTLNDRDLLVLRNPQTGTLHAIWERVNTTSKVTRTTRSGIMQERLQVQWTTPQFLSHWYLDKPVQSNVDTHGIMHVAYQQS